MRRFSTITLSLLTLILGVTAWAQASRQAQKAPRAAGDLSLVSATPASGSTVAEVSGIQLRWSSEIGLMDESSYNVGVIYNASGEEVAKANVDMWQDGYDSCTLNSKPAVDAPGVYTIVIDADKFGEDFGDGANANVTNDRIELTYTISGGDDVQGGAPVVVSSIPASSVVELKTIEVTFDQDVQLSAAASRFIFDVYGSSDMFSAVTGAYASMKEGDDKTVVFTLQAAQTASDTYELLIAEGMIFPKGNVSDGLGNEETSVFATVESSSSSGAQLNLAYPTADEVEGDTFPIINFSVAAGSKLDSAMKIYLVDENGEQFEMQVMDMISGMGIVIVKNETLSISGTYTLSIPAGWITDKSGNKSEAWSKTWAYTNPNQGVGDDDRVLEIEAATIVNNKTGESINLMDPNSVVAEFGEGWTLHITPNIYDVAKEMHLAISHYGIDEYGNEGVVYDKRIEMRESNGCKVNGEFVTEILGQTKLEEGTVYTLTFDAEDTSIAPEVRKDWGNVETTIKGGSKAYQYSSAELVGIFPPVDTEIFNPNQEFRLTFSQPVNVSVDYVEGMGFTSPVDVLPNEDLTVWRFTLGASRIENETSYLGVRVFAKDNDGLVLKGDNGFEENSCFALQWDCHLGCPAAVITPGASTLEKIYSFTAVSESGNEIALGSALDKPYLTTFSGARVAEVDMSSEIMYDKDGNVIDRENDTEVSDNGSLKVTFNLDKEITAPGKYILNFPFGAFSLGTQFSGSSSRPMQIEYIIEGDPEFDHVSIADGATVSELSYVVVYINDDVTLADNARMQLRDDESVVANATLIPAVKDGVTMLIADFMTDGKPLQLEAGMKYSLRIAKESIFLAGTDMAYPALNLNITGAGVATVNLTQEIAGMATTVSSVAKGSSASVTLEPAEGWKVGSVTLDGSVVTASVSNNVYTTPALNADATLVVAFEYDGEIFTPSSGTELVTDFGLRAFSENGEIIIENLKDGMAVSVFTIDGASCGSYDVKGYDVLNVKVVPGIYVVVVSFEGKNQAIKLNNK
ncbi:MAG: Ig-like domain-containing protein [Bacteroidales bacterium]|nr:Ig-like domain-containing protein [Bacteroidales bacterium]